MGWQHLGTMNPVNAASIALARQLARDGTARQIRLEAGLSLYDVARDLHVAPSAVSRWETGQRVPRGETAARYATLLAELMAVVTP